MKIEKCNSYEEISTKAKNSVMEKLLKNNSMLLCTASGGSPTRMYELLAEEQLVRPHLFSQLQVVKLDEWGGIAMEHPGSCESYLQRYIINPLQIADERYISFQSNAGSPQDECLRVQRELECRKCIDICILGIGMNGHIALNEPGVFLNPYCHLASLSEKSLQHPMIYGEQEQPTYGLTLGMANILQSRKIILLINGFKKKDITEKFLSGKITTGLPASFLWLHPDVLCLITED